jgi:hypothetical protein
VLEQSWRMGGASSAEVAALQSFINNPGLRGPRCCGNPSGRPCPDHAWA